MGPLIGDGTPPDWTGAACIGRDPDGFFPERGTAQITARDAKKVCNGEDGRPICPLRETCLEYALENKERFGIWGGKSERERARISKRRRVLAEQRELQLKTEQEVKAEKEKEQQRRRSEAARRAWEKRRTQGAQSEQVPRTVVAIGNRGASGKVRTIRAKSA